MNKFLQSLPGIKEIAYVECSKLAPQLMSKSIARLPIAIMTDITNVTFFGDAEYNINNSYKDGGREEKVTLSFNTADSIPLDTPLAWVVSTVNGDTFIIGTREKPYPVINTEFNSGSSGKAQITTVKVEYKNIKASLKLSF